MQPTITITLDEYNELLEHKKAFNNNGYIIKNVFFGYSGNFTTLHYVNENEVISELKKEIDLLKTKN